MTQPVEIATHHEDTRLDSLLVAAPGSGLRPLVLVLPTVMNRTDLELDYGRRLAARGYAALVADVYGDGRIGLPRPDCFTLMNEVRADRAFLQARLLALIEAGRAVDGVDADRVAAIGFCFGGMCALDIARTGADVRGVASFHGTFGPPGNHADTPIRAKVIAFHGWADPHVPADSVTALADELTAKGADWQIHGYGGVMHGFTNPHANTPESGLQYDARAERRSWAALEGFLEECFA